ncbi:MAG: shikimate dehydrogenase [Propionibacteriaceae bacterium]
MVTAAHRCAVLGSPIAHSLSPALHRAAYAQLGLTDWSYDRFELSEDQLPGFVAGCDGSWRGLSLTMPLKVVALQLGEVDELAALVGAANTLVFTGSGPRVYNTDVGGLVAAVREAGVDEAERVTILGSGATARSSLVSAAQLGAATVSVVARDPAKADRLRPLAEALGVSFRTRPWSDDLPPADVVISTVTAGAADSRADEIAGSAPVIFDAIYDPWPTALAEAAERAGRTVINGLDLLVGQAVLQIELMTGGQVPAAVLLAAGRAELDARPAT